MSKKSKKKRAEGWKQFKKGVSDFALKDNPIAATVREVGDMHAGARAKQRARDIGKVALAAGEKLGLSPDQLAAVDFGSEAGATIGGALKGSMTGKNKLMSSPMRAIKDVGNIIGGLGKMIFNHPEWYTRDQSMELVNLNFGMPMTYPLADGEYPYVLATMPYTAVIPKSDPKYGIDPVFHRIFRLFTDVRAANSGSVNYDVNKLTAYVFKLYHIVVLWHYARKLYRLHNTFNSKNTTIPQRIFHSMGVKMETEELANLYNRLVRLEAQINSSLAIPEMTLFARAAWVSEALLQENKTDRTGYYNMYPKSVINVEFNADLEVHFTSTNDSLSGVIFQIENAVTELTAVDWVSVIVGDLRKAFTTFLKLQAPAFAEALKPIYDEYLLTQISNATATPAPNSFGNDSFGNPLETVCLKEFFTTYYTSHNEVQYMAAGDVDEKVDLTSMPVNAPEQYIKGNTIASPGLLASAVRLVTPSTFRFYGNQDAGLYVDMEYPACGTEIVSEVIYATSQPDEEQWKLDEVHMADVNLAGGFTQTDADTYSANEIRAWSNMDWAPRLGRVYTLYGGEGGHKIAAFDTKLYAYMTGQQYDIINRTASSSLLVVEGLSDRSARSTYVGNVQ
jgi:hypothetical protein